MQYDPFRARHATHPYDNCPALPSRIFLRLDGFLMNDEQPVNSREEVLLESAQTAGPLGKAAIRRAGEAATILTYGTMTFVCEAAVEESGIDAEIIDLRSLLPLDTETIFASVQRTGRCLIVHEATLTSGFGAELAALVQENCFYHLEAPVERVAGWDTPYPHAAEWDYFPGPDRVGRALKDLLES